MDRVVLLRCPTAVFQSLTVLTVALVLTRLDYCNSVLYGLPAYLIRRLQSIQNAAARLIFRMRCSEAELYHSRARQPSLHGCASLSAFP